MAALIDLGTNGEVVVGNRERLLCTSTAAGPAFEGARIAMGMRAATGAIGDVRAGGRRSHCRVIGGGAPRGLVRQRAGGRGGGGTGSGLDRSGRANEAAIDGAVRPVTLFPNDVRELQLAKGAIAAGLKILTARRARRSTTSGCFILRAPSAITSAAPARSASGCCALSRERILPAGNTALLGAKRALFESEAAWDELGEARRTCLAQRASRISRTFSPRKCGSRTRAPRAAATAPAALLL